MNSLKNIKFWDSTLGGITLALILLLIESLQKGGFSAITTEEFAVAAAIAVLGVISRGLKPAEKAEE